VCCVPVTIAESAPKITTRGCIPFASSVPLAYRGSVLPVRLRFFAEYSVGRTCHLKCTESWATFSSSAAMGLFMMRAGGLDLPHVFQEHTAYVLRLHSTQRPPGTPPSILPSRRTRLATAPIPTRKVRIEMKMMIRNFSTCPSAFPIAIALSSC
jgi:hypothetical protein